MSRSRATEANRIVNILLRVDEVAEMLSVSVWQVDALVRQGRLKYVSVGTRSRRYRPTDVEAFIRESTV